MSNYIVCVSDKRHSSYEVERQMLDAAGMTLKLCACSTEDELIAQCGDADAILLDLAPMTAKAIAGLRSSAATVSVLRMSIWMRRPPQAFRSPMFPITAWRMFPTMRWR